MSLALPNTVLNTIVAEAIDELADQLEANLEGGADRRRGGQPVVKDAYADNSRSSSTATATPRSGTRRPSAAGCSNLATTPDALPWLVDEQTVDVGLEKYDVLSERELESRFEVLVEQYATRAQHRGARRRRAIARTMILPAVARHLTS